MKHLPISFASDFNQMVLSLPTRSVSIVSGHPVTGSKKFPEVVASFWGVLSRCGGRFTLEAGTWVDNTLAGDTWWPVSTDVAFEWHNHVYLQPLQKH